MLLRAIIVLHSKRFTGYIGIWVSSCFKTGSPRSFFFEAKLELVEVPVVVENESLPLVLATEVQIVRPLWLVVLRF